MGEAAEDILNGCVCENCGEFMEDILSGADAPGFPRRCAGCAPRRNPVTNPPRADRPFACERCGRSFRHKGDLRSHRRTKNH